MELAWLEDETAGARALVRADLGDEIEADDCVELLVPHVRALLGDEEAEPLLARAAERTASPEAKLGALRELSAIALGTPAALVERAQIEALLDGSAAPIFSTAPEPVRCAAAALARWTGRADAEEPLRRTLAREGQPPWLERAFLRALGAVGTEASLETLRPYLRSANPFTVRAAIGAAVAIASPAAVAMLGKLLYDRSNPIQADVARAILLLDPARGIGAITSLAADSSAAVRAAAIETLRSVRPSGSLPILLWRLSAEEDPQVLATLAAALRDRKPGELLLPLARGAQSASAQRATMCKGLLGELGIAEQQIAAAAAQKYAPPSPGPGFAWSQVMLDSGIAPAPEGIFETRRLKLPESQSMRWLLALAAVAFVAQLLIAILPPAAPKRPARAPRVEAR